MSREENSCPVDAWWMVVAVRSNLTRCFWGEQGEDNALLPELTEIVDRSEVSSAREASSSCSRGVVAESDGMMVMIDLNLYDLKVVIADVMEPKHVVHDHHVLKNINFGGRLAPMGIGIIKVRDKRNPDYYGPGRFHSNRYATSCCNVVISCY